jgi:hypothetical protein
MFIQEFELQVPEQQRILALDVALKSILARWWAAHKKRMIDWAQCNRLMQIRFGHEAEERAYKYIGESDMEGHMEICRALWCLVSKI